jgi:adhesin transport system membrane fusion protein
MSQTQTQTHSHTPRRLSMMVLLSLGLVGFIAWAAFFEIDQSVRTQGQVIASARTQVIQTVDGGVLSALNVVEGQEVKEGEVLAVLEKTRAEAGFGESRDKAAALRIALVRANAEARQTAPAFSPELRRYPNFIQAQERFYLQRKRTLDQDQASLNEAVLIAREEVRMHEALFKDGNVSQLEMLRTRRQLIELQGRVTTLNNKYRQDASAEATKLEEDLASVTSRLEERQSVLDHTTLATPAAGIVKYLRLTTIGGVLRPGDELMQISPSDEQLIIEAKVTPADIGLLHPGLPVSVKLDAFDYSVYGALEGVLRYVSPDTLSETGPNGQSQTFFRVHVQINPLQSQNPKASSILVKPGMTAALDIRTGTRSVMKYIAKPVFKTFSGALSER